MNNALYDAIAFGMRYWFLLLIALIFITLVAVSLREYRQHKLLMNIIGKYIGYLETDLFDTNNTEKFGITVGTVIGSGKTADIIINDPDVSSSHAEIICRNGLVGIAPINNSCIILNGKVSSKPCKIQTGDSLTFGSVVFSVFIKEKTKNEN